MRTRTAANGLMFMCTPWRMWSLETLEHQPNLEAIGKEFAPFLVPANPEGRAFSPRLPQRNNSEIPRVPAHHIALQNHLQPLYP